MTPVTTGSTRGAMLVVGLGLVLIGATCPRGPQHSAPTSDAALFDPPDAGEIAPADAGEFPNAAQARFDLPPAPRPDDPMERLYAHRLDFSHGAPRVRVRIMEGQRDVRFSTTTRMHLVAHGGLEKTLEAPAGAEWSVHLTEGQPAELAFRVQVAEHRADDRDALTAEQEQWTQRGFVPKVMPLGEAYGIAGRVLDTREYFLVLGDAMSSEAAHALLRDLHQRFGFQGSLIEEVKRRPRGILEVRDAHGAVIAVAQDLITVTLDGNGTFKVRSVEHDVGFSWHGREDRAYRGEIYFVADREGLLAVANTLPLEEYVRGVVPSEIYASAHVEALKAQAVTARGEVLAKIGHRHLADPYLLCAEQHCQVYKGESGTAPQSDAAITQTSGEALFGADGGGLVPSQYSAVCGGYTENNENAWPMPKDPSLRGVSDLIDASRHVALTEAELPKFLAETKNAYCAVSSYSKPEKYRWERRFTAEHLDALVKDLKVGHVLAIGVPARGVSGRAEVITLSGDLGANQIRGELNIRNRFDNLKSAMFVVQPQKDGAGRIAEWVFKGGGWGHGVGMCQLGAIGRAEHGQDYREILRHYYNGAEVVKIY